jgi:hypothetical protein
VNEKKQIEQSTAEGFLGLFNARFGTDFKILNLGDAPDVRCQDSRGKELNVEITLTEDLPRDIQAALGRSNHRSIEALRERNKKVAEGNAEPRFSSLSENVLDRVVERIEAKLLNCYGANSSLVVCDISGVDWDWDIVIQELLEKLDLKRNPFDKGIWIVNRYKTKLYAVIEGGV